MLAFLKPLFESRKDDFSSLHGIRSIACLWIVIFHTFYFLALFVPHADFDRMASLDDWRLELHRTGFSCVDVFFCLTGFLLCYPFFLQECRDEVAASSSSSSSSSSSLLKEKEKEKESKDKDNNNNNKQIAVAADISMKVSVREFYWKRFLVRIYPTLLTCLAIYCFIIVPDGLYSLKQLKAGGLRAFLKEIDPQSDMAPNSCVYSPANLLFLSNTLPFGGCMGWCWSLAIQGQFYLLLPILIRILKRRTRLLKAGFVILAYCLYNRWSVVSQISDYMLTPLPMAPYERKDVDRVYIWFTYYYMPTANRIGTVIIGMFLAYIQASISAKVNNSVGVRLLELLRSSTPIRIVGFLISTTFLLMHISRMWDHLTVPFLVFSFIGSPTFALGVCYYVFITINDVGFAGRNLNRFLSLSFWVPISHASYGTYLLHPALIVKFYITIFWEPQATVRMLFLYTLVDVAASVLAGAIIFLCVERPLGTYLSSFFFQKKTAATEKRASPSETVKPNNNNAATLLPSSKINSKTD
eukprot:TRINITY_DN975_c0_g1_i1.p1 TRINITY_DN975_c0_g1~~TRINITY_DN975_c0_g1_i1.p1  ORF type:complete len:543 (+),score=133.76 TRINITY_DN975_c0_g1_i1:52-1629(+)